MRPLMSSCNALEALHCLDLERSGLEMGTGLVAVAQNAAFGL